LVTSPPTPLERLHFISHSPVPGLAVAERRVLDPEATVICVHGGLDRGGSFARLVRRLETFDVVVYDRRGYQGSRGVQPLDLKHHVDDLTALVAHESTSAPVVVFGHSFGGVITLHAAMRDGSPIRLIVNYESPMPWILPRQSPPNDRSTDAAQEAENFFKRMVSPSAWARLSEQERESRRLDGPALISDLDSLRGDEAPFDLGDLATPFTYVHGDSPDRLEHYRALSEGLVVLNPSIATIEMKHAPHAAHLKNPDQLAAIIRQQWLLACASR
jgi:pimeloyl-ACP methyl ester carboxylesterase